VVGMASRKRLELRQFVLGGLDALLEFSELLGVLLVALGFHSKPVGMRLLGILDTLDGGLVRVGLDEGFDTGGAEADGCLLLGICA
jgi:hypothetical protein